MTDLMQRMDALRYKLADLPSETWNPSWIFDADTFRDILKQARQTMVYNALPARNEIFGWPYKIVVTEETPGELPADVPDMSAVVPRMPVLLAIRYEDRVGIVRYLFDETTDERFK